jgi:hypothetical protein
MVKILKKIIVIANIVKQSVFYELQLNRLPRHSKKMEFLVMTKHKTHD